MIKKMFLPIGISVLCNVFTFSGCGSFPTSYEKIEANKPRALDFVFLNAADTTLCEGAPGDTMQLYACFAGDSIESISWQISYMIFNDVYGQEVATNIIPLVDYADIPVPSAIGSGVPRSYGLAIKIPDSVIANNPMMSTSMQSLQTGIDPKVMLESIESFAHMSTSERNMIPPSLKDSLAAFLPSALQILSVKVRVYCLINGLYKIQKDFTVRYNRFFTDFPKVVVNHNPTINWMGIYKVKGAGKTKFDPLQMTHDDTLICLYTSDLSAMGQYTIVSDTLLVDTRYSYFAAADSGIFKGQETRDSGCVINKQSILLEQEALEYLWFLPYEQGPTGETSANKNATISEWSGAIAQFFPPTIKTITDLPIYLQVYDYYMFERNRPSGSMLRGSHIHFKYAQ